MQWNQWRRAARMGASALALSGSAGARLVAQKNVPTPESVLGFPVGADHKLFGYDESIAYFRKLASASKNVKLINVGTTSFGHPWTAVIISSQGNLKKLDKYRQINQRLAHPDGLSDADARKLAHDGKVFVDISGGLHASEIAGSQHTPQLAYELLSHADDPDNKAILDNVIFFLWPSINPDGQDIVVNNCKAREAGQNTPMELYQKYVGHDNNRDSYMLNVVESRVIQRTWREWEPDIVYVHHQAPPEPTRIWIPPFADPVGQFAPPIPAREINTIGMTIAQELDAHGQPGAEHMLNTFDAWYPGYIDYMPVYQNIASWWTETQGGNCAIPKPALTPDRFSAEYRTLQPRALYLSPWQGEAWTLRNAVDYMVTASMATLTFASRNREEVLYNRYQSGRDVIHRYRTGAPYAYIVPQDQLDRTAPVELLRRIAFMGVRVTQTDRDVTYDGTMYPKGTWVVPMDQEYASLMRELFDAQTYPPSADNTPYDAAGWTLPFQMNVNVVAGRTPLPPEMRAAMKPVQGKPVDWHKAPDEPFTTNAVAAGIVAPPPEVGGIGDQLVLDPAQNNSFRAINRALAAGANVQFQTGSSGRSGRYVVSGLSSGAIDSLAMALSLRAERASGVTATPAPARIALYKGAPGNMDEGWTEWLLDTYEFKYTLITPADLQAGNLGARFDVIVFASQGPGAGGGRGGGGRGAGGGGRGGRGGAPADSTQPNLAVAAVDEFVRGGGTALFWNGGASSAINALQLPVRNVVGDVARKDFFTGGSIMQVSTDPAHPVMAGMPARADVVVYNSPVFTTLPGFDGAVLAKYPADSTPLRSGFLLGENFMKGFAAAVDVKHGNGHVVLIAFQPQWRGQPTGTFRVVFNTLFYSRDVASRSQGTPGFWTAPPANR